MNMELNIKLHGMECVNPLGMEFLGRLADFDYDEIETAHVQ